MSTLDTFLARNKEFATREATAGRLAPSLPDAMPSVKALVISCADMRVDPAHVLGVESGEAIVLRNIGGRLTPGLVEQIGLLGRIGQVAGAVPGGDDGFHICILQHTDCGITRLAGDPALLAHFFQVDEKDVAAKQVLDPRSAVAMDVALLRAIAALPASWTISGLVYDVATGLAEIVVPSAPLRDE